jgi:hypothetical protein
LVYSDLQQTSREAACTIKSKLPENGTLCVYGTGHDTRMWANMAASVSGHLHVFEHNEHWLDVAKKALQDDSLPVTMHKVEYTSKMNDWSSQLESLPKFLPEKACDVSFVDSPEGTGGGPGRGQSSQQALLTTKHNGTIFLDDASRPLETKIISHVLSPQCSSTVMHKTRGHLFECNL